MTVRARLGLPGNLFEVPGVSALSHTPERLSSRRVTLGGRRVTQEADSEHRTWTVALRQGSRPGEVAALAALAAGEWGRGPFRFVSEWAQVTNVLTPEASVLDVGQPPAGWMVAGPLHLADGGVAGRHLVGAGTINVVVLPRAGGGEVHVPVESGVPVTASVYTTTRGFLRLQWLDATGAQLSESSTVSQNTATVPTRLALTATPPPGSSFARLRVQVDNGGVVARPAFTWIPHLLPWYPGQGVEAVTLEGLSTDVVAAWAGEGGQRAGHSFTVHEVG